MKEPHYLTEDPAADYARAIRGAKGFRQLLAAIKKWDTICGDAILRVERAKPGEWLMWRMAIKIAKRESSPPESVEIAMKDWGQVLMPAVMFRLSMVAQHYKAPWGTAYIRLVYLGKLKKNSRGYLEIQEDAYEKKPGRSSPRQKPS